MPLYYDPSGAALAEATRLARELYRLDPQQPERRRLYLTALLQGAKVRGGLDKPLAKGTGTAYSIAAYFGPSVVEDLLVHAMTDGDYGAAAAAAQILGDVGSPAMLVRGGGAQSPLVLAAQSPDRRLRFAAVGAIMLLNPTQPFAGSSQVTDALGYFAASYGTARILIIHPLIEEAQKLAGLAAGLGYEADVATNGRRGFELAVHSPDYELALVHSRIERPSIDEFMTQLRRDRRTNLLPVGLIAPLEELERIENFARSVPRTEVFLQPQNDDEMKLFVGEVLARSKRWHVPAEERLAEAAAAVDWLTQLADRPQKAFDVRREEPAIVQALASPPLTPKAASLLGRLGTANAQHNLVDLADLETQPLATRQAAAAAFATSTARYGLLLTTGEILHQYELYNANAGRDADTHAVLSTILDAIEHHKGSLAGS